MSNQHSMMTARLPGPATPAATPSEATGIAVNSVGTGSFSGVNWTISAHTTGKIEVDLQIEAITTTDINNFNKLVMAMLSASAKNKVTENTSAGASGSINFFDFICGGAKADVTHTQSSMSSLGLTDAQVTTIVNKLFALADKMSDIKADLTVDNLAFDYPVAGDLEIYTVGGTVTAGKETKNYRVLSDQGKVGDAPTTVKASLP